MGRDKSKRLNKDKLEVISIHAPVWGATDEDLKGEDIDG